VTASDSHIYDAIAVEWDRTTPGRYWTVTFSAGGAPRERVRLHSEELADLAQKALAALMHPERMTRPTRAPSRSRPGSGSRSS
jgi:hypothetical protein